MTGRIGRKSWIRGNDLGVLDGVFPRARYLRNAKLPHITGALNDFRLLLLIFVCFDRVQACVKKYGP